MRCNGVVVTRHRSLPSRSIKKRNSDKSTVDTSLELREQNVEAVREGRQSTVRWIGEWWEDNAVATATAGDRWTGGGRRRGLARGSGGTHGFPEGTGGGGGGGRGVSTYHTPSIPKSRGRLATRQIVVAGKARFSAAAARTTRGGREIKKNTERQRGLREVENDTERGRQRSKSEGNSLHVFAVRFPWDTEKRSNKRAEIQRRGDIVNRADRDKMVGR